ncbi:Bud site selection protein 6, partial [Tulasnella sp. 427]
MARLGMDVEQLFESLTSWSIGAVSELDVSDVYVRFGHDFNACAIAFSSFDINLRSVPDDLRSVLEQCLAEDASPDALERFLPRVRDIIADLRRGLQTRHTQFRAMAQGVDQRRGETQDFANSPGSGRQSSWRSASKPRPAMPSPQIPEEELRYGTSPTPPSKSMLPPMRTPSSQLVASARMSLGRRKPSGSIARTGSPSLTFENDGAHAGPGIDARPRKVSAAASFVANDALAELVADTSAMEDYWQSPVPQKASPAPTKRPTSERDQASVNPSSNAVASRPNATPSPDESPPNPPKPLPPVSPDVKRYSLIDKPVESQTESLGSYPFPDQTPPTSSAPTFSPVSATPTLSSGPAVDSAAPGTPFDPGISSQEPAVENSILALQKSDALERRATKRFSSYTFTKMAGGATGLKQLGFSRNLNRRSIAPSASIGQLSTQDLEALAEVDETKSGSPVLGVGRKGETGSAPVQVKPVLSAPEGARSAIVEGRTASPARQEVNVNLKGLVVRGRSDEAVSRPGTRPSSPRPRPPSIFLQVGRHVKKVQIDPNTPISLSSLRVLFVDKFAYNPGQDNFPAIYIRDAKSGVQYELEDIDEIKNGTLLSLNIEPLDQVKQHIDRQMMALTTEIKDLRSALDAQKRQSLLPQPFVGGSNLAAPVQAVRPTDQQFHVLARRISQLRTGDAKVLPSNINPPKPSLSPLVEQTTGDTYPPLAPETSGTTLNSDNGTTARIAKDLKT